MFLLLAIGLSLNGSAQGDLTMEWGHRGLFPSAQVEHKFDFGLKMGARVGHNVYNAASDGWVYRERVNAVIGYEFFDWKNVQLQGETHLGYARQVNNVYGYNFIKSDLNVGARMILFDRFVLLYQIGTGGRNYGFGYRFYFQKQK